MFFYPRGSREMSVLMCMSEVMAMKVAAIQMCSSHLIEENLSVASNLILEAAEGGARLVVLPEMFAIIGMKAQDKVLVKESFGVGRIQNFLKEQSRKNKIWIVGGTIPISTHDSSKIRAASLVYDDQGHVVARYDKIHLFDVNLTETESYKESASTEAGDEIVVIDTPVGKLGLAVCYDLRFPELFRAFFERGVEIVVLPSAFTLKTGMAHWDVLLRSRAIENFSYVIASNQGGLHANHQTTFGHSMIVDPWGSVISRQEDDIPGVIFATIDLEKLHLIRKSIPISEHWKIK